MQIRNPLADDATLLETHILLDLFLQQRPEKVASLMVLNKTFKAALSDETFWQNAVKRHFNWDFHQQKSQPHINWLSTFGMLHRKHYAKLRTRTKQLFSLTKEGDTEQLKKLAFALDDLFLEDAYNKRPLHFYASTSNNQALLDHCYKNILLPFNNDLLLEEIHDRFLLSFYISTTNQQSRLDPWYQMPLLFSYLDRHTIIKEKMAASGRTPLHWAVAFNQKTEIDLLILNGADFNAAAKDGTTPLFIAAKNGYLAIVEALIAKGANIHTAHNTGATPLYIAAQNGYLAVVQALIAAGANIDAALYTDATPLFVAAQNGHLAIVEVLIAKGANIHATRNDGATPLFIAANNGHLVIVQTLIANGANVNATCNAGKTSLFIAAQNGHLATVQTLIANGANVNAALNTDATPLFVAAQNGHLAIVEALIAKGANINVAINTTGRTPLSIAKSNGHHAIVKVLSKIKLKEYIAETAALTNTYQTPLTLFGYTVRHTTEQILAAAIALKAVSEGADENILNEHQGALHQRGLKPLYRNLMRR